MSESISAENYDPSEVRKFEELASRWWDPHSEFKPLHDINPLRLQYIDDQVGLDGKRILDVGCGGGILSESMAERGADVTGIDAGEAPLEVARLHLLESGLEIDYQQSTAEQMAELHAGQFDVVTCMEMLEHVPDPASVIDATARLLKPGGQAFYSTLNRTPLAFALGIVGAEHVLRLLPRGTHRYDRFIRPSELSAWLRRAGLEVRDITGLHYNPLTRSVMLGGNVAVNYLVHASKPLQ